MSPRTHIQIILSLRELQLLKKDSVHIIGVMLSRVQNKVVKILLFAFPDDRRKLYDFRAGSQNYCGLQWSSESLL